jgi:hypothetical protein
MGNIKMKSPTHARLMPGWERYKTRFEKALEDPAIDLPTLQRMERRYLELDFVLNRAALAAVSPYRS